MIDVKFAVETKDGNWLENINSIKECFEHNVKKIYETTFGGIKTMQVLVYSNSENKYCFNFMNGYFTIEALYQLQIYDAKHKILCGRHNEILSEEIAIMLGKECSMEIGAIPKARIGKGRVLMQARKCNKTTFKEILNRYHYSQFDSIFLELLSPDDLYMKSLILKRDNGLNKEDINFNRMVKGKCSCRPYGADYKWLDYLQTIDYEK